MGPAVAGWRRPRRLQRGSADEEIVCEGEKTREERDAELRGEAVSLDE